MAQESDKTSTEIVASDASLLPHLESWERMMKLPVIEAAWSQSQGVYDKMKGNYRFLIVNA